MGEDAVDEEGTNFRPDLSDHPKAPLGSAEEVAGSTYLHLQLIGTLLRSQPYGIVGS